MLRNLGLAGTALVVRDEQLQESTRFEGDSLREVYDALGQLGDKAATLARSGIDFETLLAQRSRDPKQEDRLPHLLLQVPAEDNGISGNHYFWSEEQEAEFRRQHQLNETDPELDRVIGEDGESGTDPSGSGTRSAVRRELHEIKDINRLLAQLTQLGLSADDYLPPPPSAPGAEPLPSRFVLMTKGSKGNPQTTEVHSLSQIIAAVLESSRQGMEIKRFKGLGEMDADQLWETTMNPANRVLLRVTWDTAGQAEHLFSLLMGEVVEPRRRYIEQHALEVKNLDV